jgi:mono/diheme cytochrome c family protein
MLNLRRSAPDRGFMRARPAAAVAVAVLATTVAAAGLALWLARAPADKADADDPALVAEGRAVYDQRCASCHGAHLEGQPNWRERLANGRLPAPPHDASGHTWHHPDKQLFEITKHGASGLVPGYASDMPGFEGALSDRQIWAVLAYIKSTWPPDIRARQEAVDRAATQKAAR